jgi:hypothetical protein
VPAGRTGLTAFVSSVTLETTGMVDARLPREGGAAADSTRIATATYPGRVSQRTTLAALIRPVAAIWLTCANQFILAAVECVRVADVELCGAAPDGFSRLTLGRTTRNESRPEEFAVNNYPAQRAMLPAGVMRCLPLSQRQRELFLFNWVLVIYGLISVNVIVLMLLGVDVLVAEAVALAVGFAVTEIVHRMTGKVALTSKNPAFMPGMARYEPTPPVFGDGPQFAG